jgi:hypothetical protein
MNVKSSFFLYKSNLLACSLSALPYKQDSILNAMSVGHRSQIKYIVKVCESKSGFFGIFGDRVAAESSAVYLARRDPLSKTFYITDPDGNRILEDDENNFFSIFFSNNDIILDMSNAENGDYYIDGKVEITFIKLIPPLNLLSDIIPGIVEKTEWIRIGNFRIE